MSKIMDELNKQLERKSGYDRELPHEAKVAIRALFSEHATIELEGVKEVLAERARQVAVLEADLAYAGKQLEIAQRESDRRQMILSDRMRGEVEIGLLGAMLHMAEQSGNDVIRATEITSKIEEIAKQYEPPLAIPLRYQKSAPKAAKL